MHQLKNGLNAISGLPVHLSKRFATLCETVFRQLSLKKSMNQRHKLIQINETKMFCCLICCVFSCCNRRSSKKNKQKPDKTTRNCHVSFYISKLGIMLEYIFFVRNALSLSLHFTHFCDQYLIRLFPTINWNIFLMFRLFAPTHANSLVEDI